MIIRFAIALGISSDEILGLKASKTRDSTFRMTTSIPSLSRNLVSGKPRALHYLEIILTRDRDFAKLTRRVRSLEWQT